MNVTLTRASLVPIMALLSRLVLAAAAAAVIVQGQMHTHTRAANDPSVITSLIII